MDNGTMLDSDLLCTFLSIAETGSFSRAADRMGRTQSAISMQVKRLEDFSGRPLFKRLPRGVRLTEAGEALMPEARRVIRSLEIATRQLQDRPMSGAITVGISEDYSTPLLSPTLARFADLHPNVSITVRSEAGPVIEDAFDAGDIDLAVIAIDSGAPTGELLYQDSTDWVVSKSHRLEDRNPVPIAVFDEDCWWRDAALKSLQARGKSYRIAFSSRSLAGIQAAVRSGLAIGTMGRSTAPPDTRLLGPEDGFDPLPPASIVLKRHDGDPSPAVAGMAAALREACTNVAGGR
ncbi:MAG: LysR family transcriptional regulator [Alphaproteobacteria bacterium]